MKLLYLGSYADKHTIEIINKSSSNEGQVSIAAVKYSYLIGEGIEEAIGKENITKIHLVPMGVHCKKLFFYKKNEGNTKYIPFVNLILLKQLSIIIYLLFYTIIWLFSNIKTKDKVITFSFIYLPFLLGILPAKFIRNTKIISFVPDMPSFEFSYSKTKFSIKKILTPLYIFSVNKLMNLNDSYVFITEQMKELLKNRPYMVMEGLIDFYNINKSQSSVVKTGKKALMYSGALYKKFGIKMLLDAFTQLDGNYELWLFGSGDMVQEIKRVSLVDKRVIFYGNRPNDEVLKYQSSCTVLVNPRFSHEEFTKFSFPSKLMEYASSGTPVLTTKLPGIPREYDHYFHYIESESVDGFKESIRKLFETPQEELDLFGQNAKKFVLENKNHLSQMKKVVSFINQIAKE